MVKRVTLVKYLNELLQNQTSYFSHREKYDINLVHWLGLVTADIFIVLFKVLCSLQKC